MQKGRDSKGNSCHIKDMHIQACLTKDVEATATNGFQRIALSGGFPDFSFDEMDTGFAFLGKQIALPLLISPLTGGGSVSKQVNRRLAKAAETLGLGMAVGSQKLMLDKQVPPDSYLLREFAPTIPLLANIGIVHVKRGRDYLLEAVESIAADGLVLYVNPIQEVLQEGGERDFRGILPKLEDILSDFPYPILLKEVGSGLPESLLKWVACRNVQGVDVAGLGGTNWARIEGLMSGSDYTLYEPLGIETPAAVMAARTCLRADQCLIASGGIRNGIVMVKALALGANLVAMGLPFLRWASASRQAIIDGVNGLIKEFKVAMWYTASIDTSKLYGKYTIRHD